MLKQVYKLGQVLTNYDKLRKPLSSMERASFKGEYPYYGAQGIIDYVQDYRCDGEYMLIAEDGENLVSRNQPIAQIVRGRFWVNNHAHIVKTNALADMIYICYTLNHSNISGYVTGSAQPKLSQGNLNQISVALPPLHIQQKIASILSAYDSLIENNNERIRLLEQMAENLYKEWFVRFRFPGHEKVGMENTKLGKIPKSFTITNIGSIIQYYIGGGWGNDILSDDFSIQASVIRGADFPSIREYNVSTCPCRFHKTSNYKSRQLLEGDIVIEISGGTAEQPVGRTILITQELIDRFEEGRVICASFCKLMRVNKNEISPYYLYYWMQYLYETKIIERFQLQSTGIINFKFEHFLNKGIVMIPTKELMDEFDTKVIPILKGINSLARENESLTRQRDLLLPRLMSGKLEVM